MLGFDFGWSDVAEWWRAMVAVAVPRLAPSVGILVVAAVAYFVARKYVVRAGQRLVARTKTDLDDRILHSVRRALSWTVVAWALWRLAFIWFPAGPEGAPPRAAEWVVGLWIAFLFFPLSRLACDLLLVVGTQFAAKRRGGLDATALPMATRVLRFLLIALGAMLALDRLGINIQPFLAGSAVMGLAISFAARDTLSNLIAGVLLVLDRPFQVGDRIELWSAPTETGTWGDVIDIGLRATKIRNPDNLVVVVPNNEIMRRDIVNYTMSGSDIRLRIPFSIAYESNIERAKALLVEAAGNVDGVKLQPAPVVIVRGFGASEVNLELRVWVTEARARRRIADEITARVLVAFATEGVEIPYPKRELYIREQGAAQRLLPGRDASNGGGEGAPHPR